MITLPYRGSSGYQKQRDTLTQRQATMIDKLHVASTMFQGEYSGREHQIEEESRRPQETFAPNSKLDKELVADWTRYKESGKFSRMRSFRRGLPVYACKNQIINLLDTSQVFVLSGETGCGKTTQVTQFILEHFIKQGKGSAARIVCTQPRRVAAVSVADRVAKERGEIVGQGSVGYQIKMDAKLPRTQGSILYCTAGILLQRLQSDPMMFQFTHILLDEVHERDAMTDIILVLLKELIAKRPDVKVIVMSATLNGEQFSKFLYNCLILHIPGFMHPVQTFYLKEVLEKIDYSGMVELGAEDEEQFSDWMSQQMCQADGPDQIVPGVEQFQIYVIAALVKNIHMTEDEGGILVFLPGWEDICRLSRILDTLSGIQKFSLHGSMSSDDQRLIFNPTPNGVRKVVIATNIAESSVTIDDIVYVIDCGRAKIKMFDVDKNIATLAPHWISKANCTQRKGRAGRLRPGKAYRIFSEARLQTFTDFMVPEILRTRLETIVLRVKMLNYLDVEYFMSLLLDRPHQKAVQLALENLHDIGAIQIEGDLTAVGRVLASLTVDPKLGKMIILGRVFSCLDPILSVVSALEYKSPFYITNKNESTKAIESLAFETFSDHLAVANAYQGWCSTRYNRTKQGCENQTSEFCKENCLSFATLKRIEKMKEQFGMELHKLGITRNKKVWEGEYNVNSGVEAVVRMVISVSLLPNIARVQKEGEKFVLRSLEDTQLDFYPRSVNRNLLSDFEKCSTRTSYLPTLFTYYEKVETSAAFVMDATSANLLPLILLASNVDTADRKEEEMNGNGDTTTGEESVDILLCAGEHSARITGCDPRTGQKLMRVRKGLDNLIQRLIRSRMQRCGAECDNLLSLLVRVINADANN